MKTTKLTILAIILSFNALCQNFVKLTEGDVAKTKIEIAQKFANSFLTLNKAGMPYQFNNEAIEPIKLQLTPENQKTAYNQIKNEFGDFESLAYSETWIDNLNPNYKVLRFKGNFSKSSKKLEIRVVLDNNDKINGFWIRPWSDMFN